MKPENEKSIEFTNKFLEAATIARALGVGFVVKSWNDNAPEIELDEIDGCADQAMASIEGHWTGKLGCEITIDGKWKEKDAIV